MEVKKAKAGVSNKRGYRYVWDEATNFIIYQNDNGDLIFGLSTHDGKVEEDEILKLYEISLKSFRILLTGEGKDFKFKHIVYPKNFCSLVDDLEKSNKVSEIINSLISSRYFFYDELEKKETIEFFSKESSFGYRDREKDPIYWDFSKQHPEQINKMVENVLYEILEFLYEIGKTRDFLNTYNDKILEDYANQDLARLIHNYFVYNRFGVVEDREGNIDEIYEQALEENKLYDKYIEILEDLYEKIMNCEGTDEDHVVASETAILYRKITGTKYNFHNKYLKKVLDKS